MSGHSKWHSIKHKKGALDAKRGKIFTKHAKLITIAARGGGDPDMNPSLRSAITNAKADNVPNANIEKAVKKGSGEDKNAAVFVEALYEGYGPEGTAMLVEVITDNKNRSAASVKIAMTKNGGNMASSGSVAWMFDRKGMIITKLSEKDEGEAELEIIDAGADDLELDEGMFEIMTAPSDLMKVRDNLEEAGFEVERAELVYLPKDPVKITDKSQAEKILQLVEALEDDDDVSKVHSNFDIPEDILEELL
jgi:YebC/PmpR family DNA-binding regulatory protein